MNAKNFDLTGFGSGLRFDIFSTTMQEMEAGYEC